MHIRTVLPRPRRLLTALVATVTAAALIQVAAPGSALADAAPTGVTMSGTTTAPTFTVTGSGFGATAPTSYSAAHTSCEDYGPGNGRWFGTDGFWFLDNTHNWQAGRGMTTFFGSPYSWSNCLGVYVDSWSNNRIVFHFGLAYGTQSSWFVQPGDNYVLTVNGQQFGGALAYPSAAPAHNPVTVSGTTAYPTVTIAASSGLWLPAGYPAETTSCGYYGVANGDWYGLGGLWFTDNTNGWQAGRGTSSGGDCIGIVVDYASPSKVVFHFGVAYNSFSTWYLRPGDHFVVEWNGHYYGGVAQF